jgi:hypothetical protein
MERAGGLSPTRERLKTMLKGDGHATSSQVEREWNRIVYESCLAIREALDEAADWIDLQKILARGWGRKPMHNWQVASWLMGRGPTDLALVRKRLDQFQRLKADAMFRAGVTVRDGTCCAVAKRRPQLSGGKWGYRPTCRKTEDICCQPSFLAAKKPEAHAAAEALVQSDPSERAEDIKLGKKAIQVLSDSDPTSTKGSACHGKNGIGGDLAIALECGPDEVLLTTDKSFDQICPALGIQHQRF